MMKIKKHDYVELDYTGKTKDEHRVFDTTMESVAKEKGFHNPEVKYKPVVICVGKRHVVKGLDESLVGKELGKFSIEIKDVDAFGKKDAKLLKLIPMKLFSQQKIQPFPGLDVNVDGQYGIVKSVGAGRVIVDFNHPLSSKDVVYDVEVKRIVTDKEEMVKASLDMFGMPYDDVKVEGDKAVVEMKQELPAQVTDAIIKDLVETTGLTSVEFKAKAEKHEHSHGHDHDAHDHKHEHEHPVQEQKPADKPGTE